MMFGRKGKKKCLWCLCERGRREREGAAAAAATRSRSRFCWSWGVDPGSGPGKTLLLLPGERRASSRRLKLDQRAAAELRLFVVAVCVSQTRPDAFLFNSSDVGKLKSLGESDFPSKLIFSTRSNRPYRRRGDPRSCRNGEHHPAASVREPLVSLSDEGGS